MENDDDLEPDWDDEDLPEITRQVEALCSNFGEYFVAYVLGCDVMPDTRGDRLSDTEEFRMMAAGFTDAAPEESEVIAELTALAQEVASLPSAYWRRTKTFEEVLRYDRRRGDHGRHAHAALVRWSPSSIRADRLPSRPGLLRAR